MLAVTILLVILADTTYSPVLVLCEDNQVYRVRVAKKQDFRVKKGKLRFYEQKQILW